MSHAPHTSDLSDQLDPHEHHDPRDPVETCHACQAPRRPALRLGDLAAARGVIARAIRSEMTLRVHLLQQIATLAATAAAPAETLELALADVLAGRLVTAQRRLPAPASTPPEADLCPVALPVGAR